MATNMLAKKLNEEGNITSSEKNEKDSENVAPEAVASEKNSTISPLTESEVARHVTYHVIVESYHVIRLTVYVLLSAGKPV